MAVSRILAADEFALLTAILGLLAMCSYPLNTLSTAINHFSSLLGRYDDP